MNFWCDNNISWRIADAISLLLRRHEHTILHIRNDERFKANNNEKGSNNTPDTVWIPALGKDNIVWNVISGDHSILVRDAERELLAATGLTFFYVDKYYADSQLLEQGRRLIWLLPEILKCADNPVPGVYKLITGPRNWKVELELYGRKSLNDLRG